MKACMCFYVFITYTCTYIRSKNCRVSSFQHFLYLLVCLSFTSCFTKKVLLLHITVNDWVSNLMSDCQLLTERQTVIHTGTLAKWLSEWLTLTIMTSTILQLSVLRRRDHTYFQLPFNPCFTLLSVIWLCCVVVTHHFYKSSC